MEIQIAVSKIRKYAVSSSGDTVEVIERPQGGVSVVLADGQSSGRGAKVISNLVVRKVIALLAEGVRDGAAARAAADSLFTEKGGKVSATLSILSVDQASQTLVITRNQPAPAIIRHPQNGLVILDEPSQPIGIYRHTRPVIAEVPLEVGLVALVFSDGLMHAGERQGSSLDIPAALLSLLEDPKISTQAIADGLLQQALIRDDFRPVDDISVVVLQVSSAEGDSIRRMTVRLPLNS